MALRFEVIGLLLAQLKRGVRGAVEEHQEALRTASALWELLDACPATQRRALVLACDDFWTAELCELLCEESRKAAADSAERAIGIAQLAVELAAKIDSSDGWRSRVQGYCGVHLANSLRMRGDDLPAAEQAFLRALDLWEAGAGDDPGLFNAARVLHIAHLL